MPALIDIAKPRGLVQESTVEKPNVPPTPVAPTRTLNGLIAIIRRDAFRKSGQYALRSNVGHDGE
ncbi:hypothetical protein CA13_05060 [Planctomycetes bacterium CA13]|uniref:Uncharacterized protein n=1 Tax=Novipirellula herctigrandis TaxID=2527986 RepID=A0A5C5YVL3_9BACT|nr:hypothetical protein CA13_05060 [Planctomycetes bacterium CA13]